MTDISFASTETLSTIPDSAQVMLITGADTVGTRRYEHFRADIVSAASVRFGATKLMEKDFTITTADIWVDTTWSTDDLPDWYMLNAGFVGANDTRFYGQLVWSKKSWLTDRGTETIGTTTSETNRIEFPSLGLGTTQIYLGHDSDRNLLIAASEVTSYLQPLSVWEPEAMLPV